MDYEKHPPPTNAISESKRFTLNCNPCDSLSPYPLGLSVGVWVVVPISLATSGVTTSGVTTLGVTTFGVTTLNNCGLCDLIHIPPVQLPNARDVDRVVDSSA